MNTIVWSIAGSDSSGHAGIQADLKTFHGLGVHGCTVITAVTAQNTQQLADMQFVSMTPQIACMQTDLMPRAIKIGMLGHMASILELEKFLTIYNGMVILDPVLVTTAGGFLFATASEEYIAALKKIFQYVDVLTPNISEAEMILQYKITSHDAIVEAAHALLALGAKSVLIKGGHHVADFYSQDYWTNGQDAFWLSSERLIGLNFGGTGCTLSAALAASCALGYDIPDSLVIAKMFVNQAMRLGSAATKKAILQQRSFPDDERDLPYLSDKPLAMTPYVFPDCEQTLGLYPVVDSSAWVRRLLSWGIKTIQLRIKDKTGEALISEIKTAVQIAKEYHARLFINDHWESAIACGAYGVHLGQEDLKCAVLSQLQSAGLRLGVSTHNYQELSRAHSLHPSYIAFGPIYATNSKTMACAPQGIEKLKHWRRIVRYPLVAIGGINENNIRAILETGVDGVALIAAITKAEDPERAVQRLLDEMSAPLSPPTIFVGGGWGEEGTNTPPHHPTQSTRGYQ
ncbi:MAG: hypothetical protein A3F43_05100 [Gammaproteobacteria bacterium RIFCSPHIGHO2_12_FULL_42_10]|nr:MAG: hypothetical protein A3F43_05100 [Gammaproteobacteria bacterium RIFCSPHIGHO2_12_FULL_42_10]